LYLVAEATPILLYLILSESTTKIFSISMKVCYYLQTLAKQRLNRPVACKQKYLD